MVLALPYAYTVSCEDGLIVRLVITAWDYAVENIASRISEAKMLRNRSS